MSASDRERPLVTGINGPLMARRTAVRTTLKAVPYPSPVLLDSCRPSGRGRRDKAREATACGFNAASLDLAAGCQPVPDTFRSRVSYCPRCAAELL